MQQTRNIATFQAPHFITEDLSTTENFFCAESRLSEFLKLQLTNRTFEVGPALNNFKTSSVARTVDTNGDRFWVSVGYDRAAKGWTIHVTSTQGFISRIFGRTDSSQMERLCSVIDEVLKTDNDIVDIEWQTYDEWRKDAGSE